MVVSNPENQNHSINYMSQMFKIKQAGWAKTKEIDESTLE